MSAQIEPPAFRLFNPLGVSPYLLICEHASRFIPERYNGLGLSAADLQRHIAWDIGAEAVTCLLAQSLDAVAILANYSRLLIDLNRPTGSSTSIPVISETTRVPGNANLQDTERRLRIARYFLPFQTCVRAQLEARRRAGIPTIIVGMHSFTPVFNGHSRPWRAGILFRRSHDFGHALVAALGGPAAQIAANEPYQIDDESDYTVPVHGEARGLDAVLVELRQDLITDDQGARHWAERMVQALHPLAPRHAMS